MLSQAALGGLRQGCHTLCDGVDKIADDDLVNHFVNSDAAGRSRSSNVLRQQVQVVQVVRTCLEASKCLAFFNGPGAV